MTELMLMYFACVTLFVVATFFGIAPCAADELWTTEQAAAYLQLKPQTLTLWRSAGRYDLPYVKLGTAIRYRKSDLDKWLEERTVGASK